MAEGRSLEGLALSLFGGQFRGRRVLLTGHTGFKGSWMALWLQRMGAEVTGIALAPATEPSHWALTAPPIRSLMIDVRDAAAVGAAVRQHQPEIVFHLAAQALVRPSYQRPVETWSTNVMGTTHVLEACRLTPGVRAIVVVTSDKCYDNPETGQAFVESDPLGGYDPYSASKAATELVAASYRRSFFGTGPLLATARAGNVIGGGDWAADRLLPDLVRGVQRGRPTVIRNPDATRPWQHVLESVSGYLQLGQRLLEGDDAAAGAWNFGPGPEGNVSVGRMLEGLRSHWPGLAWQVERDESRHEARLLQLDAGKARRQLAWRPVWTLQRTQAATAEWYSHFLAHGEALSDRQLGAYLLDAQAAGLGWATP